MYKKERQMKLEDFVFPYGTLKPENEWVKLAELIPWDLVEERYASQFENNGHPAHPARMALGALLIKQRLRCSDEWTVRHVSENPYLQYFLGMKEYGDKCPFGASTMVAFRKRFSEEALAEILEMTLPKEEPDEDGDDDSGDGGTLIMDATCCPADMAYPQDLNLLNEAREKLEATIDEICRGQGLPKPQMYRKKARKDYLKLAKSKKRTAKQLRKAIGAQLLYIRRDMGYIVKFVQTGVRLSSVQRDRLNLLTTVYEQQRILYETRSHSILRRIVSLSQPWVRPIPRGKARAKTEFGLKLYISLVGGYARMERLSFEAYNEADDFYHIVERYRQRHGGYPACILADRIYRNRQTLAFCKEHGIRLTGSALGRPPKDHTLSREQKRQEYADLCDRNAVEVAFGTLKTSFGLGRLASRLESTSRCAVGIALLWFNLSRRLRLLLSRWLCWFYGVACSSFFMPVAE